MFNRTAFFWKIGILSLAGTMTAWWMYGTAFPQLRSAPAFCLFFSVPFFFSLSHNAIHSVPVFMAKIFAWAGGYWLIFTIYSFMGVLFYASVYLLCALLRPAFRIDLWPAAASCLPPCILLFILTVLVIGTYRALVPVYRHITVETRTVEQDTVIAFLSDTHFSPLLSHWFVKAMVRRINAVQADAVIFGGDLIDAHLGFIRRDKSYIHLQNLQAPLGIYAIYGNHDYFDSNIAELAQLCRPLRFLHDERLFIGRHIALTGMSDYIHAPHHALPPAEPEYFNIIADHEPLRIVPAARQGYDVYLAGHTHGGQFFPETLVNKRMYTINYGKRRFGSLLAVVTSGYGFWGMPVRTGPRPEIVVLRILKQP